MAKRKKKSKVKSFVLNCVPSYAQEDDFTYEDALTAGAIEADMEVPATTDLREDWWPIDNQGTTGACVGYATAYGVLKWHYVAQGWLSPDAKPSARFIWMANKETDELTRYPTTFLESDGTQTKLALKIAQKYGCVEESILPMKGDLCSLSRAAFYTQAARFRISSYHNLGRDLNAWKTWIAQKGPVLTRLDVDQTWDLATENGGELNSYQPDTARGGHAVCLVGYTPTSLIVRNSWGTNWGDKGFAYASNEYAKLAFTEAYGAVV